jgi:hypothetical protein
MPDNAVLGTIIGLAFIFFLFALTCSAAVESIANLVNKRPKFLLRGLQDLLDPPASSVTPPDPKSLTAFTTRTAAVFTDISAERSLYKKALHTGTAATDANDERWTMQLMGHALVTPSRQSRTAGQQTRNPSYLSSATFATALIDLLVPEANGSTSVAQIRRKVSDLPGTVPFRQALLGLLSTADGNLPAFRKSLERWYDDQMDRISGSYKRWAKRWAIVIGLSIAAILQVDSIAIGTHLYAEAPLREAMVAAATNNTLCPPNKSPARTRACVTRRLKELHTSAGLPIGWGEATTPTDRHGWLIKVLGWTLTALAASLGAPFWFDALSKLGPLRNAGAKPATTT